MREKDIEKYLKDEVSKIGGLCYKFNSSESGVPDRIVIFMGVVIFVELKNETGRLAKLQRYQHEKIKSRGGHVWIINSKLKVNSFIKHLSAIETMIGGGSK